MNNPIPKKSKKDNDVKEILPDVVQCVTDMEKVLADKAVADKEVSDKVVLDKVVEDNKLNDIQNEANHQDSFKKSKFFGGKIFCRNCTKCTIAIEFSESKYEVCLDDFIMFSFIEYVSFFVHILSRFCSFYVHIIFYFVHTLISLEMEESLYPKKSKDNESLNVPLKT